MNQTKRIEIFTYLHLHLDHNRIPIPRQKIKNVMKSLNVIFSFLNLDQDHSKRKAAIPTLKRAKNKIIKDPVKISIIFLNIDNHPVFDVSAELEFEELGSLPELGG